MVDRNDLEKRVSNGDKLDATDEATLSKLSAAHESKKKKKIVRDYEEKMSYDDKVSTKVSGPSYDFWLVFWLVLGLEYWLVFWLVLGLVGLTLASSMESPWALMLVFWLVFWLVLWLEYWLVFWLVLGFILQKGEVRA